MNDENEIRIAWEIWNLINRLHDLLFDHYHDNFQNLCSEEQNDLLEKSMSPSPARLMEEHQK